jgi:hypothetical protein
MFAYYIERNGYDTQGLNLEFDPWRVDRDYY